MKLFVVTSNWFKELVKSLESKVWIPNLQFKCFDWTHWMSLKIEHSEWLYLQTISPWTFLKLQNSFRLSLSK